MGKVLIIDDSDFDRRMIRKAIELSNRDRQFQFTELQGGSDIVGIIAREKPDLTILDVRMPMIDGFEVLSQIRASDAIGDRTVIMVSGSEEQADRDLAAQFGADAYFVKPPHAADYFRLGAEICETYMADKRG